MKQTVGYESLLVWQKAHILALEVHKTIKAFPKEETFGITSQLRRAALSVPTNIVEVYARCNPNFLTTFINAAHGLLIEVKYLLRFVNECGYLSVSEFVRLNNIAAEVGGLLWKFQESVELDRGSQIR